ncbi:hypothetical protein BDV34DRAFT_101697 [Aspergillus parasiticus]|uniref:non-specific serine/threonine protein kinase n=1 Tax=Aspergillus parasiticus TaxID=5067 RepID=A0A5N6DJR3_ASPPA|nr:hypothetical protein BDV34DRAFT_101697 [Aspergillus parasiticus]
MRAFHQKGHQLFRQIHCPPRVRHSSIFPVLDPAKNIEDERMPAYDRGLYYPVKLGGVFCSRYQGLSKLGFGANSTGPETILIDARQHRYIALKIYIHSSNPNHEVQVVEHLAACRTHHPGKQLVRNMIDWFEITGLKGSY